MEATSRGETVIVTELLNCGADVNLQDHVRVFSYACNNIIILLEHKF